METITKWCEILPFPTEWKEIIKDAAKNFDAESKILTPMENLLKILYECEEVSKRYKKIGIDEKILYDTLEDIVIWTHNHHTVNGEVGLSETDWIRLHMNMKLFCVGRLQFCFGKMREDCSRLGIGKGDCVIDVHIPQGKALDDTECKDSFARAVKFFEKYFPEYEYRFFTCRSWLLDFSLKEFLPPESNIIKFQSNFDIVSHEESKQAIERLFTLNSLKNKESSLQKKVRVHVEKGGKLYEGYGVADKKLFAD